MTDKPIFAVNPDDVVHLESRSFGAEEVACGTQGTGYDFKKAVERILGPKNPPPLTEDDVRMFGADEISKFDVNAAMAACPISTKGVYRAAASILDGNQQDRPAGSSEPLEQAHVRPAQSEYSDEQAPIRLTLSVEVALCPARQALSCSLADVPSCNSLSVEVVATATVTEGGVGASRAAEGSRHD